MKKNAMLKIAAVLLVAVLLTTCAISSTFAKYATQLGDANASARVAKWGITADSKITTTGALFATSYEDGDVVAATVEGEQDNVVAPGTEGSLTISFVVKGAPEVKSQINLNDDGNGGDTDTKEFLISNLPVVWSISSTTDPSINKNNCSVEEINSAIANFAKTNTFDANTQINIVKDLTISWSWAYEVKDGEGNVDTNVDKNDTDYGNNNTAYTATFKIKADIVQVGD